MRNSELLYSSFKKLESFTSFPILLCELKPSQKWIFVNDLKVSCLRQCFSTMANLPYQNVISRNFAHPSLLYFVFIFPRHPRSFFGFFANSSFTGWRGWLRERMSKLHEIRQHRNKHGYLDSRNRRSARERGRVRNVEKYSVFYSLNILLKRFQLHARIWKQTSCDLLIGNKARCAPLVVIFLITIVFEMMYCRCLPVFSLSVYLLVFTRKDWVAETVQILAEELPRSTLSV